MLKLNLGCGVHVAKEAPWVNVDKYDTGEGNMVFNLAPEHGILDASQTYIESFLPLAWPWDDSSVDEVLFNHSLEHMGQAPAVFLGLIKELYRVCCDGAIVHINVPSPRHDEYLGDPTHVRPVTADMWPLFSKKANQVFREKGGANSCFAFLLDVDFELMANQVILDDRFQYLKDDPAWTRMAALNNNVVRELRLQVKVIKDVVA